MSGQLIAASWLSKPSPRPGLVVVDQLLLAEYDLRRKGDVGDLDYEGLERLKTAYLLTVRQWADRDPDAFLANEDHPFYLSDLNRYGDAEEGRH